MGFKLNGVKVPAIVSADDMTLLAYTKPELDRMIKECYNYSCLWRYEYNAKKSAVIVCNESKSLYKKSERYWVIGNDDIQETDAYTHLGILFSKNLDLSRNIDDINSILRKSFFSLNCFGHEGLNPITVCRIYKTMTLPKGLYGCELLYNISPSGFLNLERSH